MGSLDDLKRLYEMKAEADRQYILKHEQQEGLKTWREQQIDHQYRTYLEQQTMTAVEILKRLKSYQDSRAKLLAVRDYLHAQFLKVEADLITLESEYAQSRSSSPVHRDPGSSAPSGQSTSLHGGDSGAADKDGAQGVKGSG